MAQFEPLFSFCVLTLFFGKFLENDFLSNSIGISWQKFVRYESAASKIIKLPRHAVIMCHREHFLIIFKYFLYVCLLQVGGKTLEEDNFLAELSTFNEWVHAQGLLLLYFHVFMWMISGKIASVAEFARSKCLRHKIIFQTNSYFSRKNRGFSDKIRNFVCLSRMSDTRPLKEKWKL